MMGSVSGVVILPKRLQKRNYKEFMFDGVKKIENLEKHLVSGVRILPEDRGKLANDMREWRKIALKKKWRKKDEFDFKKEKEDMRKQIEGWKR